MNKAFALSVKRWARRQATPSGLKHILWAIFRTGLIIGISYVILYPMLVKLSASFMSAEDLHNVTVKWFPRNPTLDNYKIVFEKMDYMEYFFFTFYVTIVCTLLQVSACTFSAYGYARFRFKGRNILFALVILSLIIPPQTYIISSYKQFLYFDFFGIGSLLGIKPISLTGTPLPLFILSLGCQATKNGLFIYIMRQFFQNLPTEIEEAAEVDGAGVFRTFFQIMLPNARGALLTIAVYSFVWNYNDLYLSKLYMPGAKMFSTALSTLTYTLTQSFGGVSVIDTTTASVMTNTGALMIMLPLILLFCLVQKLFIEGVERTGITG